ncbi:hypothetical protein EPN87_02635 [archaeon]|nr:MAG: hypothetical protein EPN87_02635 [archaeon]
MKGIAVPYIIALILGIVIIGLLGYWFFVLGGQVGGTGTMQTCSAKQAAWCQQWSVTGFSGNCPATQFCTSINDANTKWQSFAPGCDKSAPTQPFCQASFGSTSSSASGRTTVDCIVNDQPNDGVCTKAGYTSCDTKTGFCV